MMDNESIETLIKKTIDKSHIVFFSKPGCTLCVKLEEFLTKNSYTDYTKIDLYEMDDDKGLEVLDFLKNTYEITTFPICFVNTTFVGTYSDVMETLKRETIFSANIENF